MIWSKVMLGFEAFRTISGFCATGVSDGPATMDIFCACFGVFQLLSIKSARFKT